MEKFIYFDNASTAWPKPEKVYSFMMEFYRQRGVNPGRSGFDKAMEAGSLIDKLRRRMTAFFGGDEDEPDRLCFAYNATDALNLIIRGVLSPGDHVVATNLEHNAVIRPINHLTKEQGIEADFVPFDDQGFIDPEEIRKAIKPNTKLVALNHASNVIGTIQPVEQIGKICKENDALFLIDVSQTAGVVPINMKKMNVDALAFTGHKALMGSTGIGGLCVRKHVELKILRSGGTGVNSVDPFQPEEYPWRMEIGTPNILGIASLWAGLDWIEERGMDNIYKFEHTLALKMVEGFKKIEGVRLYHCDSMENHLPAILINIDGIDPGNAGIKLDVEHEIAVRIGLQCAPLLHKQIGTLGLKGGVRFSIGAFNTEEEVDAAVEAVSEIASEPIDHTLKY